MKRRLMRLRSLAELASSTSARFTASSRSRRAFCAAAKSDLATRRAERETFARRVTSEGARDAPPAASSSSSAAWVSLEDATSFTCTRARAASAASCDVRKRGEGRETRRVVDAGSDDARRRRVGEETTV